MLSKLTGVLMAMVLLFGGTGITAYASQQALPGESLYSVKALVEDLQMALTFDEAHEIELRLAFAERRIMEIGALLESGEFEPLHLAGEDLEWLIEEMLMILNLLAETDEGLAIELADLVKFKLEQFNEILSEWLEAHREHASGFLEEALEATDVEDLDGIGDWHHGESEEPDEDLQETQGEEDSTEGEEGPSSEEERGSDEYVDGEEQTGDPEQEEEETPGDSEDPNGEPPNEETPSGDPPGEGEGDPCGEEDCASLCERECAEGGEDCFPACLEWCEAERSGGTEEPPPCSEVCELECAEGGEGCFLECMEWCEAERSGGTEEPPPCSEVCELECAEAGEGCFLECMEWCEAERSGGTEEPPPCSEVCELECAEAGEGCFLECMEWCEAERAGS